MPSKTAPKAVEPDSARSLFLPVEEAGPQQELGQAATEAREWEPSPGPAVSEPPPGPPPMDDGLPGNPDARPSLNTLNLYE